MLKILGGRKLIYSENTISKPGASMRMAGATPFLLHPDPRMNSYNRYAYGAVADWIYRYAAGIDVLATDLGFHTILLHPNFDARLGNLNFSYESAYGTIRSAWSISGGLARWNVTIPANTKGHWPIARDREKSFKLDGQSLSQSPRVRSLGTEGGREMYEIPAGTYAFEVSLQ